MVDKEKIKDFPDAPGVYFMKDARGEIIYVGKAGSLKKRLSSYFSPGHLTVKTGVMMSYVQDISYEQLGSEHEAFLREAELIKQWQPRFNISLKDDKSYPYVIVTHEDFPRVCIGRRRKKTQQDADFFGPYTNVRLLRRALKILRRSFPFCTCRTFPGKACLNFDLHLCPAPCLKKISRKKYLAVIRSLEDFLTKKDTDLVEDLSRRLQKLVRQERFEEAAQWRDQLEALAILTSLKKGLPEVLQEWGDWEKLGLKREPRRIETFDISNIGGEESVGSMVSFLDGHPDKANYRRFRIRTVAGIDDYAMMREVVGRRYRRLREEGKKLPDLILIDGGPGHLAAARDILLSLNVTVPLAALAKEEELVYTPRRRLPVRLERSSQALRTLQACRDEAHRFAVRYHHLLREKKTFL